MEWKGFQIPCIIAGSKRLRLGQNFTIKAVIKCEIMGGQQTIFSKRVPIGEGNRPGVILLMHGSCIEFRTFQNGGKKWIDARTWAHTIKVGQVHEVLVLRSGNKVRLYINGIDQTNVKYDTIAGGDVNCDSDAFIGMQFYNTMSPKEPFYGNIYSIGIYEDAYFGDISRVVYPRNPNIVPLSAVPEVAEQIGLPRV